MFPESKPNTGMDMFLKDLQHMGTRQISRSNSYSIPSITQQINLVLLSSTSINIQAEMPLPVRSEMYPFAMRWFLTDTTGAAVMSIPRSLLDSLRGTTRTTTRSQRDFPGPDPCSICETNSASHHQTWKEFGSTILSVIIFNQRHPVMGSS